VAFLAYVHLALFLALSLSPAATLRNRFPCYSSRTAGVLFLVGYRRQPSDQRWSRTGMIGFKKPCWFTSRNRKRDELTCNAHATDLSFANFILCSVHVYGSVCVCVCKLKSSPRSRIEVRPTALPRPLPLDSTAAAGLGRATPQSSSR